MLRLATAKGSSSQCVRLHWPGHLTWQGTSATSSRIISSPRCGHSPISTKLTDSAASSSNGRLAAEGLAELAQCPRRWPHHLITLTAGRPIHDLASRTGSPTRRA
eukprot:3122585-Pyramimonas_sp.AAC.1